MRSTSRADVLIPLLVCLVEGAWIAVVDALFGAGARRPPLGPIAFGLAAGAGLFWVRRAAPDAQRPGLVAIVAIVFVGAAWLARGESLFGERFPGTLLTEPAGWLAVIAVYRGTRHDDPAEDDLVVSDLLRWGIPLLTIPWLLAVALPVDTRVTFVSVAFPATVLFAGGGLLALGLSRLEALAIAAGVDWRRNRGWLPLLLVVVALVLVVAIPAALLLGAPLGAILGGLVGPFAAIISPIVGFVGLILAPLLAAFFGFIQSLMQIFPPPPGNQVPLGPSGAFPPPIIDQTDPGGPGAIIATIVTLLVIAIGLLLVARAARRGGRLQPRAEAISEEHEFVLPSFSLRLPRVPHRERFGRPASATGAYLAFLADAERTEGLARLPTEGPETHARRVRAEATDLPEADLRAAGLLAADYELERYALRDLPPRETRRALSRWQRLRAALRSTRR